MRYTVLIWILIILTLAGNILSHLFNWHKPVCCIPSVKNKPLSSDIRIRRILEVEICIRRMWILKASSHHYIVSHFCHRCDIIVHYHFNSNIHNYLLSNTVKLSTVTWTTLHIHLQRKINCQINTQKAKNLIRELKCHFKSSWHAVLILQVFMNQSESIDQVQHHLP